jgi:15-cis-phytoene synthase / lycopene beta-cyclase
VALTTLYLWAVDTGALNRGTWVIAHGTKLGLYLWPGLEIEEAVFFLVTNAILVCGQVCFDHALAILATFPARFPTLPELPSPFLLIRALCTPASAYDPVRLQGLRSATSLLSAKSRSFSLASAAFSGE